MLTLPVIISFTAASFSPLLTLDLSSSKTLAQSNDCLLLQLTSDEESLFRNSKLEELYLIAKGSVLPFTPSALVADCQGLTGLQDWSILRVIYCTHLSLHFNSIISYGGHLVNTLVKTLEESQLFDAISESKISQVYITFLNGKEGRFEKRSQPSTSDLKIPYSKRPIVKKYDEPLIH